MHNAYKISVVLLLAFLVFLFGCESEDDSGNNDSKEQSSNSIEWVDCPVYENVNPLSDSAECAIVKSPLDHNDPGGEQIDIFVYRYLGSAEEKKGQFWMLEGGPGGSGLLLSRMLQYLVEMNPEYDFYSLDHRGVGNSTRLGCPGDNEFYSDYTAYENCYDSMVGQWGDKMAYFTTTQAAHDLYHVATQFKKQDDTLIILGFSYGTYWLQRFMQLYPKGADGIILDSICSPGSCYLDQYDGWNNEVGHEFLDICADDATCSAKMAEIDSSPAEAFESIIEKAEDNTLCDAFNGKFNRKILRNLFASNLQSWSKRVTLPAFVYRLNRCNESDQTAIANYITANGIETLSVDYVPEEDAYNAPMLCDYISVSELYSGRTLAEAESFAGQAIFADDASLHISTIVDRQIWDEYSDPEYAQKFAETDMPLLMMNGTTDPQTPLKIGIKTGEHFTGEHQTWVTMPYSTHGVMIYSAIDKPAPSGQTPCGSQLINQFLADPEAELDLSCVDQVYPLEFSADSANNQETSLTLFGTEDMWDGVPGK